MGRQVLDQRDEVGSAAPVLNLGRYDNVTPRAVDGLKTAKSFYRRVMAEVVEGSEVGAEAP